MRLTIRVSAMSVFYVLASGILYIALVHYTELFIFGATFNLPSPRPASPLHNMAASLKDLA